LEEEDEEDFIDDLKMAMAKCQQSVLAESELLPQRRGMGTTLTMAYIVWPRLYVVHVGDSRCYRLHASKLGQLTRDHTMARELVASGILSDEEAERSRWSHVLWNAIGNADEVKPEVYRADLTVGDTLLLCSDGLTKHVPDEWIRRCLEKCDSSEQACEQLVDEANQAGGTDNITVVVARFQDLSDGRALSASCSEPRSESAEDKERSQGDTTTRQATNVSPLS
jgi:protein phosphatase